MDWTVFGEDLAFSLIQPMVLGVERQRLHGLDALRGIAALAVFLCHLLSLYGIASPSWLAADAVDLFFLLSGFVLARTYEERLASGSLTVGGFMARRYRRLWFPAALGAAFGIAWAVGNPALAILAAFVAQLAFMPALWSPARLFILNGPAWSLFVEIVTNIVHAIGFSRRGNRAVVVGIALSLALYLPAFALSDRPIVAQSLAHLLPAIGRGLALYLMGVLVWRKWGDTPIPVPPLAAVLTFPLLAFGLWETLGRSGELVFSFMLAPLVLRSAVALPASRWAASIGGLSYPLYAVHWPLIVLARQLGLPLPAAASLAFGVAVAVAVGFELPREHVKRACGKVAAGVIAEADGVHPADARH